MSHEPSPNGSERTDGLHGESTSRYRLLRLLLTLLLLPCMCFAAAAASEPADSSGLTASDVLWVNSGDGLFGQPLNWSPAVVPGQNDLPLFSLKQDYTVTSTSPLLTAGARVRHGTVSLDLSGNAWQMSASNHQFIVGVEAGDDAALRLVSGHLSLHEIRISSHSDASGLLAIDGPNSSVSNSWGVLCAIGHRGSGRAEVLNGGTVSIGLHTYLGYNSGSDGMLIVDGEDSQWSSGGTIFTGGIGNGHIEVRNRGHVSAQDIHIGITAAGDGSLHLTDPGSLVSTVFNISVGQGAWSSGELIVANKATADSFFGKVGEISGSNGYAEITDKGSQWIVHDALFIGFSGNGVLNVKDGGAVLSKWARIGLLSGATGHAVMRDPGSRWSNQLFISVGVAENTTARLDLLDGATIESSELLIGPWGTVHADGVIEADIANGGTLAPARIADDESFSPGTLSILGNYTQQYDESAGVLHARVYLDPAATEAIGELSDEITSNELFIDDLLDDLGLCSGTDNSGAMESGWHLFANIFGDEFVISHDQVIVSGTATLSGQLIIELPEQLPPDAQLCLPLIEAAEIVGEFDDVIVIGGPGSLLDATTAISIQTAAETVTFCMNPPGQCTADLNGDGNVDGTDLLLLLGAWGPCDDPLACEANIAGDDDEVNALDLLTLLSQWGPCP